MVVSQSQLLRISGKAVLLSLMMLIMMMSIPFHAFAATKSKSTVLEEATIVVDGEQIELNGPMRMLQDRLFAPVTSLTKAFEATVEWEPDDEEVTIHTREDDVIVLGIGVPVVRYNDGRYLMDVAPFVEGGRTYLPVRYVADLLRAKVVWNQEEQVAEVTSISPEEEFVPAILSQEVEPYTDDDLTLLAKITMVEAGYEGYEGQLAVANVILNRVKDERFPSTIKDVIYSGKQFPPAHNGLLDKSEPNESVMKAAKDALNGKNNVEDAVYFYNPKVTKGTFWSSLEVIAKIGTHRFAK